MSIKRFFFCLFFCICFIYSAYGQQYTIEGKILNNRTNAPIDYATVVLSNNEFWDTTDDDGHFQIKNVHSGKVTIVIHCFGYEKKEYEVNVDRDISDLVIHLNEKALTLNEVVVTAQGGKQIANSYVIDRVALDHMQMISVADINSLLPGGKTNSTLHLVSGAERLSVNGGAKEEGNATFGTAVEVDGVRISNNSGRDFNTSGGVVIGGPDIRNIASTNIESVEIVTGVPSVEYGDLTNGMVKINSKKGKTPFVIDMATKPNTKQIAVSKGLDLNNNRGILNLSYEHTKSISNLASPYTSYDRNGLFLNYSNVFNRSNDQPITFNVGLSGNVGGYDSKSDPDLFVNTYTKQKDNVLRANVSAKWLLKKKWITNLEMSGAINYTDKLLENSENKSRSSSTVSIRTPEEGYHIGQAYEENPNADIILIPPGYWYELSYLDSKPLSISAKIKADWVRKFGIVNSKVMIGGEYSTSSNKGRGRYYADPLYTPTWREYRYDKEPALNNYAIYAEDLVTIPVNQSRLEFIGGVRSDITSIDGSEYGTVNSLSPRFNARYVFWEGRKDHTIRDFNIRLGWGKAVKLPPSAALYALPSYNDILTFAPGTTSEGKTYYAYYTIPSKRIYNNDLRWQYNIQQSIGVDINIKGTKVSLNASRDKTYNPYMSTSVYEPFTYNFTDQKALESSLIPIENRIYNVNKNTGIVTVTDNTGIQTPETLSYSQRLKLKGNTMYINGSPVERRSFDWIVEFGKIQAIKTSIRWDGSYYYYKNTEESIVQGTSSRNVESEDVKYIGYYVGSNSSVVNGEISKSLNTNLTLTTHIPTLRLIVSLRLEASLYNYSQSLSEYKGKALTFNIADKNDNFPSGSQQNIYEGNSATAIYPLYYSTYDDLNTKIPFAEKYAWAKENDKNLYNELSKLVNKNSFIRTFKADKLSAYYSANISVTKEIGRFASISFNAINFLNSLQKVHSEKWDAYYSLYGSYIPSFYYGMSLRIKL
ncbi:TonB-dependent receptor [Dysgonomonas sp. Marseille-P4677]|uniref:TonB-dependent receptor n=1 Tax=Dysgonomonas sp. Marseille-P4677 TaxID=2364790 RepID=UPI0019149C2A|nr:carboxypeptidase-like regulatory domain-containing protein [Dysgonomonas sp. Marseille-P4677]MBK5720966.1 TonB-dependent receptor [Dysgonomonas sp. Marseille-P4677]